MPEIAGQNCEKSKNPKQLLNYLRLKLANLTSPQSRSGVASNMDRDVFLPVKRADPFISF